MSFPLYQIDAFTIGNESFTGNPASVCILQSDDDISDEIKQKIAAEVNQSMTAFVARKWASNENIDENCYKIRYFTPICEFAICGHATVATTLLLYRKTVHYSNGEHSNYETKFEFETRLGEKLLATIDANEMITLSMPIHLPKSLSNNEQWVKDIVDLTLGPSLDFNFVEEVYLSDIFILIKLKDFNENMMYKIEPNFQKLLECDRTVTVTQKANFNVENVHFYSRVFAPWIGINEDPVCGTAHTQLTPFWKEKLGIDGQLIAKQCSKRGGIIKCNIKGDRVELTANAIIVFEGNLFI